MQQKPFFTRNHKPRQFRYEPVYYDADKEKQTEKTNISFGEHRKMAEVSAEEGRETYFGRRRRFKKAGSTATRTLMLLLVLCGTLFYLYEAGFLHGFAVLILLFIALFIFIFRR